MPPPALAAVVLSAMPVAAVVSAICPLVAAAVLLPGLAGAVERQGRVGHFLHAVVADFGEPDFDGLGFGAGDGLNNAQERGGFGAIGFALFTVRGGQFELYDFLVRLLGARLLCQLALEV